VAAAILLDAGTIADQALGRRAVNLLRPEARGRINALFTGIFFVGGAVGSAIAGVAWASAGWNGVALVAIAFALATVASGVHRKNAVALVAVDDA
jgi:predicted MFS family arabinose efflux permease